MKLSKIFSVIIILSSATSLFSQNQTLLQEMQKKYPGHSEVIISNQIKYDISEKNGELNIFQDSYFESIILNQQGISNYTERFYDSELSSVVDYEAYTLDVSNKKIKTDLIKESVNTNDGIFYDNVKEIEVTFKGLEAGSRKVLQYRTQFIDPHLLHRFIFKNYEPAKSSSISVVCDKDIEIGYIISNDPSNSIEFTKVEKRKKLEYTWTMTDVEPYKFEDGAPTILYTEPHISVYIKSYQQENKKVDVLSEVDQLYAYYASFVEDLNNDISPELESIANELTNDLEDEEAKVKAIYYWVKDNIKYIAYENGYEGFIPREASLICSRKFGDCKDMSSVITAMCHVVGIDNVKLCWIGTRDLPYSYAELPTPAVDNHMIAAYLKGDDIIFLDGTDSHVAYPYPSSFIQGKQALIGIDKENYILRMVPIIEPEINVHHLTLDAKIEDKTIQGSGFVRLSGYPRTNMIARLTTLNKGYREETIKNRINFGNNKLDIQNLVEKNVENRDLPLDIEFDFSLESYLIALDKELYLNPFIQKVGFLEKLKNDRTLPFETSNLVHIKVDVKLQLEKDQAVSYLSNPYLIDSDLLYFKLHISDEKEYLLISYELKNRKLILQKEDFQKWNQEVQTVLQALDDSIIITKN